MPAVELAWEFCRVTFSISAVSVPTTADSQVLQHTEFFNFSDEGVNDVSKCSQKVIQLIRFLDL